MAETTLIRPLELIYHLAIASSPNPALLHDQTDLTRPSDPVTQRPSDPSDPTQPNPTQPNPTAGGG